MVLSMTGYGKGIFQSENFTVTAELKSLNGKSSDIRCKLPSSYKEQEIILRKLILEKAYRGKMEYNISIESESQHEEYAINEPLFKKYYTDISQLKKTLGMEANSDVLQAIMRIPEVVGTRINPVSEEEYNAVMTATKTAIENLNDFRKTEGKVLHEDLMLRSNNILSLLDEVAPHEENRIVKLKEKLTKSIEDGVKVDQIDRNRFEQELIYYLEKLDINEEKVRLKQHCLYFNEILNNSEIQVGKKLGFIAQEIGREINTLGAKAQDKNLQKIVVCMKDELEKMKEQLYNVI